jgi:hypothetical protein
MNRTQRILTIALVIQLLLLGALYLGSRQGRSEASRELLPQLAAISPTSIQISAADDQSVALVREAEGWVLQDPPGYPVAAGKVDELLGKLEELSARRPVVTSGRYHDAFKVTEENHERRLRIWGGDEDEPEIDLLLGSSPNFDLSHVRVVGDDRVYEVRGLGSFDLRTDRSSWVERKFVDVPVDDVVALQLRNSHGEIELARESGLWTLVSPAGGATRSLDSAKVDSWVRSVSSLFLADPAHRVDDAASRFDQPSAVLEIRRRTGGNETEADSEEVETLHVTIGAELDGEDGKRYAMRSGFEFSVILSRFDAEKLTEKKLEDLYPDAE